jgi:hypothetical protein
MQRLDVREITPTYYCLALSVSADGIRRRGCPLRCYSVDNDNQSSTSLNFFLINLFIPELQSHNMIFLGNSAP